MSLVFPDNVRLRPVATWCTSLSNVDSPPVKSRVVFPTFGETSIIIFSNQSACPKLYQSSSSENIHFKRAPTATIAKVDFMCSESPIFAAVIRSLAVGLS